MLYIYRIFKNKGKFKSHTLPQFGALLGQKGKAGIVTEVSFDKNGTISLQEDSLSVSAELEKQTHIINK